MSKTDEIADNLRRSGGPLDADGKPYEIGIWSDRLYSLLDAYDRMKAALERIYAEDGSYARETARAVLEGKP